MDHLMCSPFQATVLVNQLMREMNPGQAPALPRNYNCMWKENLEGEGSNLQKEQGTWSDFSTGSAWRAVFVRKLGRFREEGAVRRPPEPALSSLPSWLLPSLST